MMDAVIPLRSVNGSLNYAIARQGAITHVPIDGDPRRIIVEVPLLLRGVTAPLDGPGATYQGLNWWVYQPTMLPGHGLISLTLKRAQLAQCCTQATIKTLDRVDDCTDVDHVVNTHVVSVVSEHLDTSTHDFWDGEHQVDFFKFHMEAALVLGKRHVIAYNGQDFKVHSVQNSGNPLELTTVVAQRIPLARAVA